MRSDPEDPVFKMKLQNRSPSSPKYSVTPIKRERVFADDGVVNTLSAGHNKKSLWQTDLNSGYYDHYDLDYNDDSGDYYVTGVFNSYYYYDYTDDEYYNTREYQRGSASYYKSYYGCDCEYCCKQAEEQQHYFASLMMM